MPKVFDGANWQEQAGKDIALRTLQTIKSLDSTTPPYAYTDRETAIQVYVSPARGSDSNPGTWELPFQTAEKAKTTLGTNPGILWLYPEWIPLYKPLIVSSGQHIRGITHTSGAGAQGDSVLFPAYDPDNPTDPTKSFIDPDGRTDPESDPATALIVSDHWDDEADWWHWGKFADFSLACKNDAGYQTNYGILIFEVGESVEWHNLAVRDAAKDNVVLTGAHAIGNSLSFNSWHPGRYGLWITRSWVNGSGSGYIRGEMISGDEQGLALIRIDTGSLDTSIKSEQTSVPVVIGGGDQEVVRLVLHGTSNPSKETTGDNSQAVDLTGVSLTWNDTNKEVTIGGLTADEVTALTTPHPISKNAGQTSPYPAGKYRYILISGGTTAFDTVVAPSADQDTYGSGSLAQKWRYVSNTTDSVTYRALINPNTAYSNETSQTIRILPQSAMIHVLQFPDDTYGPSPAIECGARTEADAWLRDDTYTGANGGIYGYDPDRPFVASPSNNVGRHGLMVRQGIDSTLGPITLSNVWGALMRILDINGFQKNLLTFSSDHHLNLYSPGSVFSLYDFDGGLFAEGTYGRFWVPRLDVGGTDSASYDATIKAGIIASTSIPFINLAGVRIWDDGTNARVKRGSDPTSASDGTILDA